VPRKKGNGWREGSDPIQRWLRVATTITVLGVFVFLALGDDNQNDVVVLALALGAVLVLLGYEGVVRLPFLDGKDDGDT
jgi:hypothetical protein